MRGLSEKRREVIEDMGSFAGGELMGLLKDPETNWQPQDWLPDPSGDDFLDQVRACVDDRRRDTTTTGMNLESRAGEAYLVRPGASRPRFGFGFCMGDDALCDVRWRGNGAVVERGGGGYAGYAGYAGYDGG